MKPGETSRFAFVQPKKIPEELETAPHVEDHVRRFPINRKGFSMTISSDQHFTVIADLSDDAPSLREIRHDIHRHPELSYEETRTAALVAERLEEWGWTVTRGSMRWPPTGS